jgi:integrase
MAKPKRSRCNDPSGANAAGETLLAAFHLDRALHRPPERGDLVAALAAGEPGGRTINFDIGGRKRTKKKRGIIPIPPRLLPHLHRVRKRGTDLGYVLHINGERIKDIKKGFAAACARAGIADVTPHTLKHTAATWLMQSGTDPWQAAGFLSTSVETLLRVYGHHHPDYQRQAAENIGKRPQHVRVIA